jgi:hypothetical protein
MDGGKEREVSKGFSGIKLNHHLTLKTQGMCVGMSVGVLASHLYFRNTCFGTWGNGDLRRCLRAVDYVLALRPHINLFF